MLKRVFSYISGSVDMVLKGSLSTKDIEDVELHLWPDADLGGDLTTTKSTSGAWFEFATPDMERTWPIAWSCTKQTQTSCSTNESESKTLIHQVEGFPPEVRAALNAISSICRKTSEERRAHRVPILTCTLSSASDITCENP